MKYRVFRDRSKLLPTYVPMRLPHRESQMHLLMSSLLPVMENEIPNTHVIVTGNPGTGKTAVIKNLIRQLSAKSSSLRPFYVNCRIERIPGNVVRSFLSQFLTSFSPRGLSIQEMLFSGLRYLVEKGEKPLLILDDADHFFTSHKEFIYMLTRVSEYDESFNILSLIFVIHSSSLISSLDPWTAGCLRRNMIYFGDYNYEQLVDILDYRVAEAFYPESVLRESIETCADISSLYGFNARYALELMLKAGEIAEIRNSPIVTPEHVRLARREVPPSFSISELKNLNVHEKLILLTISKLLSESYKSFITMGELESEYINVCESYGISPVKHTWLWKIVNDLSKLGFISRKISGKGMKGKTTLIGLPSISAELLENFLRRELYGLKNKA